MVEKKYGSLNTCTVKEVIDDRVAVIETKIRDATDEVLEQCSDVFLGQDNLCDQESDDINEKIVSDILTNVDRTPEGRLIMPLPWNDECKERLGTNFNLSKKILNSNRKKLSKDGKLLLYDQVFKEQEELGIVQRIENIDAYMKANPGYSFLPHMDIFKMNKETTKVRVYT